MNSVKPFGTIARDFQFVRTHRKEILEELLEISPNYPELPKQLCRIHRNTTSKNQNNESVPCLAYKFFNFRIAPPGLTPFGQALTQFIIRSHNCAPSGVFATFAYRSGSGIRESS